MTAEWHPPRLCHPTGAAVITRREADVLAGICHGHSSKQIAARLCVTENTVKSHIKGLFRALHAKDRANAAALASSGQVTVLVRGVA